MSDLVNVVNSEGEVEQVSPEAMNAYLRNGYTLDTPELAALREEKEKYGSTTQAVKAFGEEFLNAPTLGIGHRIEESLGVSPEDILKRKKYNPTASMSGGISGILGASLLPGLIESEGAGATAAGLASSPMAATSAIGEGIGGIAEGATKRILAGVPKEGFLGSIADYSPTLVGGTANAAAQSAILNAAQKIDETHLAGGNFQQGVDNALATTGDALRVGALSNIVLQGGGHLLSIGAQKSLDSLQNFIRDEVVPRATNSAADAFASASSKFTGEPIENFSKYTGEEGATGRKELLTIPKNLSNKELSEQRDKLAKELYEKMDAALSSSNEMAFKGSKEGGEFSGIIPKERAKLLEKVHPETAMKEAMELQQNLRSTADMLSSDPIIYAPNVAKKVMSVSDDFQTKLKDLNNIRDMEHGGTASFTASDVYDLIDQTKANIANRSKFGSMASSTEKDALTELKKTGSVFKKSLENQDIWGEQAARQAQINSAVRDHLMLTGKAGSFRKDFMMQKATASGTPEWVLDRTKFNTFLNKLGSARGERHLDAINEFLDSSQELINQTRASGSNIGKDLSQDKYVQSLLSTAQEKGALTRLGEAHENLSATHGVIQKGIEQQGEQAKLRALANGPFVTGIDPSAEASSGLLGPMGGAAMGATLGHVGLGGVGIVAGARAVKKALNNPLETLQTLAKIEKFNDTTSRRIQSGISSFLKKSSSVSNDIYESMRPAIAYEESRKTERQYKEQLKKMAQENSDPTITSAKYHTALSGGNDKTPLANHAPKFSAAVADKQAKIQNWLWSKFPKNQSLYPPIGGDKFSAYHPSKNEMMDFYAKQAIAKDPLSAIEKLKHGVLSLDDVLTLKTLWPSIYQQLQYGVIEKLSSTKHDLTPKQKRQLEILVGHPIEDSQDPQLFQLVQKNFEEQDQVKKAVAAQADRGLSKLSDDSKTATQRLQR